MFVCILRTEEKLPSVTGAARHKHGHPMGATPPPPAPFNGALNCPKSNETSVSNGQQRQRLKKKRKIKSISPLDFSTLNRIRKSLLALLRLQILDSAPTRFRGHNLSGVIKFSLGVYDFKTAVKVRFNVLLLLLPCGQKQELNSRANA